MTNHKKDTHKENSPNVSEPDNIQNPTDTAKTEKNAEQLEQVNPELIEAASETSETEKALIELLEKLAVSEDKYLRLNAEFDNFRKRVIREKSDIRINAQFDVLNNIVPILDHFEFALGSADQTHNLDKLFEGMKLIKTEFERALANLGVELISAVGKPFDPKFHEAIAYEASEEVEKELVLKQWRTGYKMGDRLIRPATVVISSGKA
ncbi:MAG: nucleotide exchange factor GrpE [Lentisphaerota bacterium]